MQVSAAVERVRMRAEEVRTPGTVIPGVERIAVVRADRLGDFILTLPAIEALRAAYPRASLGVVVGPHAAPLARLVPAIDRVETTDRTVRGTRAALGALAPHLVVSISRDAAGVLAAVLARAPHRIGSGFRVWSPLLTRRVAERRRAGGRHEVEYALSFAHRAGAPAGPARFHIAPQAAAERETARWLAERGLADRPFAIVHAGSGGSCPSWPMAHFSTLAEALEADGLPTVATVGPHDAEIERALARREREAFRFPLEPLVALVRRAALLVSNSTAPVHLAAALGTPALALHAPWSTCSVARWGPYHASGAAVVAHTPGEERLTRAERRARGASLLAGVPPEFVLGVVRSGEIELRTGR